MTTLSDDTIVAARRPELNGDLLARLSAHVQSSGETLTVLESFTGERLCEVPASTVADVEEAFAVARSAQADWASRPVTERVKVLARFHTLLLDERDLMLDLLQAEGGKARRTAMEEMCDPLLVLNHYLRRAPKLLKPVRRRPGIPFVMSVAEHHLPKGVVGLIAPWNFPLAMSISDIVPALLAGNGAVIKPASETPLSLLLAADLLQRAGLPKGLLRVVIGEGRTVGQAVAESGDFVAFTGSTVTGREVARTAADRLVECSLELGGKNPMVVLDDADLAEAAAAVAASSTANAGQLCMHIERVHLPRHRVAEFIRLLVEEVDAVRLTADYDYSADTGSLVSEQHMKSVAALVEEARDQGAHVHSGGRIATEIGPWFYAPTVLSGVTPQMRLHTEEVFGPVVSVYGHDSVDEAVTAANDSPYGLNASVWGGDLKQARKVAAQLQAGTVNVNDAHGAAYASMDAAAGGVKSSGLGHRHGDGGLLKYTDRITVAVQRKQVQQSIGSDWAAVTEQTTKAMRLLRKLPF